MEYFGSPKKHIRSHNKVSDLRKKWGSEQIKEKKGQCMADEIIKIKIVPESYPHDIGEVEITVKDSEIQLMGKLNAYISRLESFLTVLEEIGFNKAVGNATDYKKINSVRAFFGWSYDTIGYDRQEKDLTNFLSESLKIEIERYKTDLARIPQERQTPYIKTLIDEEA